MIQHNKTMYVLSLLLLTTISSGSLFVAVREYITLYDAVSSEAQAATLKTESSLRALRAQKQALSTVSAIYINKISDISVLAKSSNLKITTFLSSNGPVTVGYIQSGNTLTIYTAQDITNKVAYNVLALAKQAKLILASDPQIRTKLTSNVPIIADMQLLNPVPVYIQQNNKGPSELVIIETPGSRSAVLSDQIGGLPSLGELLADFAKTPLLTGESVQYIVIEDEIMRIGAAVRPITTQPDWSTLVASVLPTAARGAQVSKTGFKILETLDSTTQRDQLFKKYANNKFVIIVDDIIDGSLSIPVPNSFIIVDDILDGS